MRPVRVLLIAVAVGSTLIGFQHTSPNIALAQTDAAAPNHVHYTKSADQDKPSPNGRPRPAPAESWQACVSRNNEEQRSTALHQPGI